MKKILIVDDEEWIRMLYTEELINEGYNVISSGEGSDLNKLIKHENPDLVVLDIKLGGYSGLDLLQGIRNHYYDLSVIICSAYSIFRSHLKSMAADYYVVKNSDLSELKSKIRMALGYNLSDKEMIFPEDQ